MLLILAFFVGQYSIVLNSNSIKYFQSNFTNLLMKKGLLLDYGIGKNDSQLLKLVPKISELDLGFTFPYMNIEYTKVSSVLLNGYIEFSNPRMSRFVNMYDFPMTDSKGNGDVFFRNVTNNSDYIAIDSAILKFIGNDKMPYNSMTKNAFVITWSNLSSQNLNDTGTSTFQLIMATNKLRSFLIFSYSNLINSTNPKYPVTGFRHSFGYENLRSIDSIKNDSTRLSIESNIGIPGIWVFEVNCNI